MQNRHSQTSSTRERDGVVVVEAVCYVGMPMEQLEEVLWAEVSMAVLVDLPHHLGDDFPLEVHTEPLERDLVGGLTRWADYDGGERERGEARSGREEQRGIWIGMEGEAGPPTWSSVTSILPLPSRSRMAKVS